MAYAYEKNTNLAYDTKALRDAAEEYGKIAKQLTDMSSELANLLGQLKEEGWTTPAGKGFYELSNAKWKDNIDKYAKVLGKLQEALNEAAKKYDALTEDHIRTTKLDTSEF